MLNSKIFIMKNLIFDNQHRLKYWLFPIITSFVMVMVIELVSFGVDYCFLEQNYSWHINTIINILSLLWAIFIVLYSSSMKNKYRIINDEKIVIKEYLFFIKTVDLVVPINMIKDIKIEQTFNVIRPHIAIYLPNRVMRLNCITHQQELYDNIKKLL